MPAVPDAGVPLNDPVPVDGEALNVTPVGKAPENRDIVGNGTPEAVTLKLLAESTVKLVDAALVKLGATGVFCGVTITVPEAGPGPAALDAVTEQVNCTPLLMLPTETMIGDALLLPDPLGVQDALYCVMELPPLLAGSAKERLN